MHLLILATRERAVLRKWAAIDVIGHCVQEESSRQLMNDNKQKLETVTADVIENESATRNESKSKVCSLGGRHRKDVIEKQSMPPLGRSTPQGYMKVCRSMHRGILATSVLQQL